jgi:G:T-mismatch repair DNA endonuclease (very short patch repair protein)
MAKRNTYSFKKLQKEIKRDKKAKEKLARRQGKRDQVINDVDEEKHSD